MKKSLLILEFLLLTVSIYAQKFEIISEYKFDGYLQYYESQPDDDGYNNPGLEKIFIYKDRLYLKNSSTGEWIYDLHNSYKKNIGKFGYTLQNQNLLFLKEFNKVLKIYTNSSDLEKPDYSITLPDDIFYKSSDSVYFTDNYVFMHTSDNKMISWTLFEKGKYEYHDKDKTAELLRNGLGDILGFHENPTGSIKYFGEFEMTNQNAPNLINMIDSISYKNYVASVDFRYWGEYIGTDKRGLSYYYSSNMNYYNYNKNDEVVLEIAVLDPWKKEVDVMSLSAGEWNPARDENGLLAACGKCIDNEGNIYFVDCNKDKGCYEIKKLKNDWIMKYDFYNREIGKMNENHIPLKNEASATGTNNGFNFEYEYLWILEHKNEWCKIRKVDGREGWIEERYIDFD